MSEAATIRLLLAAAIVLALLVTWRSNTLDQTAYPPMQKSDVEAIIVTGLGEVIKPQQVYKYARKDMVKFKSKDCDLPSYVLPGSLHNDVFQYLLVGGEIDINRYEKFVAYLGDVRPPLSVVQLYLEKLQFDIRAFFGAKPIRYGNYGLFFLAPKGCNIRGQFAWADLWLG